MPLPILAILAGGALVAGSINSMLHLYPPLWNAWQKWSLKGWPNVNPQVAELIELRHRGELSDSDYQKHCAEHGLNNAFAEKLYTVSKQLLSVQDYITLWRRGELSEDQLDANLKFQRLNDDDIRRAKIVTEYFPQPQDLVRFAVRDVYSPEVMGRFGMMEDLPHQFMQEASKAGLPSEQARNYWAAHWQLPSAGQGFEMLHRGVIGEADLKLLLRALDVMPFWREALIKISYNPLTRVDVRRMYALGVLNEEDVYSSYLDVGYSPENAQRMTQFTVAYESDEMTGLTRSSVLSAYKKGLIGLSELEEYLQGFGYAPDVVAFWLSSAEHDKQSEDLDDYASELQSRYLAGMLTLDQVRAELNKADLPATYINTVMNKLTAKQSAKTKIPSKADLEKWLELGLITDLDYADRMNKLGYMKEDIELYLSEIEDSQRAVKPKFMGIGTYKRWFKAGIIKEARVRQVLQGMGKQEQDITNFILENRPTPQLERET